MNLRRKPMQRGKAIVRANPARRAKMFERNFGARASHVRRMRCLCAASCTCAGLVQAAHVVARGMGGCGGDKRDLVPLCGLHHEESGPRRSSKRAAFEVRHGVNLQAEARRIAIELDTRGLP